MTDKCLWQGHRTVRPELNSRIYYWTVWNNHLTVQCWIKFICKSLVNRKPIFCGTECRVWSFDILNFEGDANWIFYGHTLLRPNKERLISFKIPGNVRFKNRLIGAYFKNEFSYGRFLTAGGTERLNKFFKLPKYIIKECTCLAFSSKQQVYIYFWLLSHSLKSL